MGSVPLVTYRATKASEVSNFIYKGYIHDFTDTILTFLGFFSVSLSHLLTLQIWWLLSLRHGAHWPQLSFLWQPMHSPQRFRFFLFVFSESRPMLGVGCCDPRPFPALPFAFPLPRPWPDGGGVSSSLVTFDGDLKAWSVDEMAATWPGVSVEWSDSDSSDPVRFVFFLNWAAKVGCDASTWGQNIAVSLDVLTCMLPVCK